MAIPLAVNLAPIEAPPPRAAGATAGISPPASDSAAYLGGSATGSSLEYELVSDFAWWIAAALGWTTRNRGGRRYTGAMHGLEDGARRRKG